MHVLHVLVVDLVDVKVSWIDEQCWMIEQRTLGLVILGQQRTLSFLAPGFDGRTIEWEYLPHLLTLSFPLLVSQVALPSIFTSHPRFVHRNMPPSCHAVQLPWEKPSGKISRGCEGSSLPSCLRTQKGCPQFCPPFNSNTHCFDQTLID